MVERLSCRWVRVFGYMYEYVANWKVAGFVSTYLMHPTELTVRVAFKVRALSEMAPILLCDLI
jgi:hypothetical protein